MCSFNVFCCYILTEMSSYWIIIVKIISNTFIWSLINIPFEFANIISDGGSSWRIG